MNRLCASGLNAIGDAARAIRCGETEFAIAGGVESMTRAPLVMGKAQEAFQRSAEIDDTTLGWRFINPLMKAQYGVDSMAETGENVAEEYQVARADQDAFALRSQQRAGKAIAAGYFAEEIVAVEAPGGKAGPVTVDKDEHPRPETTLDGARQAQAVCPQPRHRDGRQRLRRQRRCGGGDPRLGGSRGASRAHAARARARHGVGGGAAAGDGDRSGALDPQADATARAQDRRFRLIEINEAFASQGLACLRQLGVADDAEHVNPHGGAIALGHPLGMSGARLALTALHGLEKRGGRRALATMCVGVGQGVSLALERV